MTRPWEAADLAKDLRALGVQPGQHLLVHSSLGRVGWLADGAATLLDALREVAGPSATIVVPTFTAGNSGSSAAFREATRHLDQAARVRYLASMPGFERRSTPSQGMGKFAEHVRTRRQAFRSVHPQTSFAAIGARARECTEVHDLGCRFGDRSPLGWLWEREAAVLLLGVDYDKCTAFHLAEYWLFESPPTRPYHCFTAPAESRPTGERQPEELWDADLDETDFAELGGRMDRQRFVSRGRVGAADCRLVPIRRAVDFALTDPWFQRRRVAAAVPLAARNAPPRPASQASLANPGGEQPGRYFFLSYSRLPPLPTVPVPGIDVADPPDEWVRQFFGDLRDEVTRRAVPEAALRPGFLDTQDGSHWRSGLTDALGAAEVFVPLLSPDYYRRSWPGREWSAFTRRVADADPARAGQRCVPVLWEPLSGDEHPRWLADALSLAPAGASGPYADLGLRAMLRQPGYRPAYRRVLDELAARIVATAERARIGPSAVVIPEVGTLFGEDDEGNAAGGRVFTITVLGHPARDGARPAEYLRHAAERQGFAVRVRELGRTDGPELVRFPGFLLAVVRSPADRGELLDADSVIAGLPPWVLPVVIDLRPADLPGEGGITLDVANKAYAAKPGFVRHGLAGVGSLREAVGLAPFLIAHAEREYLRPDPDERAESRPVFRPRLAGGGPAETRPGKENPHD